MAKYKFKCSNCNNEDTRYTPSSIDKLPCACGSTMERQMPITNSPVQVNEVIDPYTNKKWQQDQQQMLDARNDEHYWSVEVPRLVNSGTYSMETMLEQGWLVYNEKHELVLGKAPNKR